MTRKEAFQNRPMINSIKEANDIDEFIRNIYDHFEQQLQAKEGEVVAEFQGELYLWNGDDWLNNIENLISSHLDIKETYTVKVMKEVK